MLMKDDPEMGNDALDIDEGVLTHLSNLEVMTRKELIRKWNSSYFFRVPLQY